MSRSKSWYKTPSILMDTEGERKQIPNSSNTKYEINGIKIPFFRKYFIGTLEKNDSISYL